MKDEIRTPVPASDLATNQVDGPLWTAGTVVSSLIAAIFLASALWVWHAVPVSAQDLKDASWLYGAADVEHFTTMFVPLGLVMALLGLAVGVARNRCLVAIHSVLVGSLLAMSGLPSLNFIVAANGGVATVGCFVWETTECHEMLGLASAEGLPSMYAPRAQADRTGEVYTPEYDKQITEQRLRAELFVPSVAAVALTPLIAAHTDELNEKLNAQRAELAHRRAAQGATRKH